ncbi:hypothetical protein GCM10027088_08180 [Nocardia goodfellowii]
MQVGDVRKDRHIRHGPPPLPCHAYIVVADGRFPQAIGRTSHASRAGQVGNLSRTRGGGWPKFENVAGKVWPNIVSSWPKPLIAKLFRSKARFVTALRKVMTCNRMATAHPRA